MIEFTSVVSMLDSAVYGHYLPVPPQVSKQFKNTDRRVKCILNGKVNIHCALMPKGEGAYMILMHKDLRKKLNAALGDSVRIQLEKDTTEYGIPLSEELKELWEIDPEAYEVFHTLTKGKQRSLIYIVNQGKRSETRVKKAVAILEYLKTVNGKLDYREMNQFIKNYNSL